MIKKNKQRCKCDNFCYRKIKRAITEWGAIQKIPILLSQYLKTDPLDRIPQINSHFGGTNINFAYYIFSIEYSIYKDICLLYQQVLNNISFIYLHI